ncbi:hypothetical protein [Vulcanisaeta sp. JCM 16159]|uniref:hypothetical protein n=1 Tax=Vulcanisaeta sp. JCM 16159 TaxID=1295371 RepID=UPI000ACE98D8|nr:hypothetical protein [Vulcanisaeta sp. JCM 16159]
MTRNKLIPILTTLTLIAVTSIITAHILAATPTMHPMIRHGTDYVSTVYSLNWAGYVIPAREGTVTSVAGSFIVPS